MEAPMRDKILDALRSSLGEYVSGEDLSKQLGVSRTAIWKHISSLREQGYAIHGHKNLGYRLDSIPDLLLPAEIKHSLKTTFVGKQVHYYERIGSTNDVALDLAGRSCKEGTIAIAEEQTKGRGRLGRSWYSPYGVGIYLSVVLRPAGVPPIYSPVFTMLSALAVADTIKGISGITPVIKWPNDVLVAGRKVSGILVQMKADPDKIDHLVVGIGVNLNQDKRDFPQEITISATSLKACTGVKTDRVEFLCRLLEALENYYIAVRDRGDYQSIKDEWLELSGIMGKDVAIRTVDGLVEGRVVEVSLTGGLDVESKDGTIKKVFSGDILSPRGRFHT
jgi:BirA family biotin operon repressor/biotin-[acetyl-CoA-carboxylase] ligase